MVDDCAAQCSLMLSHCFADRDEVAAGGLCCCKCVHAYMHANPQSQTMTGTKSNYYGLDMERSGLGQDSGDAKLLQKSSNDLFALQH